MNFLLHYLNLIFDIFLWPFSSMPEYIDIFVLSLISAVIFLYIFKKTSNQEKIKLYKQRIYGHILQIVIYKDQLGVIFKSIFHILKNNVIYLGYMLPPLLFMVIPLWLFSTQINNRVGYSPLDKNQTFILRINLDKNITSYNNQSLEHVHVSTSDGITIDSDPLRIFSEGSILLRAKVTNTDSENYIRLYLDNSKEVLEKKIVTSDNKKHGFASEKSKFQFLKSLTVNAETFIPDHSPFKSVIVSYQRQTLPLVWWNMDPLIIYLVLVLILAFLLKPLVRVNI